MNADIVTIRRANLRAWMQQNGVPAKEKSFFYQLANGDASFGEKAARRLERDYKMGEGYLDQAPEPAGEEGERPRAAPAVNEPAAVYGAAGGTDERTMLIRATLDDIEMLSLWHSLTPRGRAAMRAFAEVAEKEPSLAATRHQG